MNCGYIKILFIFILFIPSFCLSQSINLKFDRYSKDNGLSTNAPTSVIKDSRGLIWIASQNGINRFDGSGFKIYSHDIKNPNSLSDDYVLCLCEDFEHNIWAGTMGNGLNKLNRQTEKFEIFLNDSKDENTISSNNIRALIFDEGKLYIGTQNGGLNIYDIKTKKFTKLKNNPGNPLSLSNNFIWTLFKDREGTIWVGTNGSGLDKLDKRINTFTHYMNSPGDQTTISHNEVRSIYEDKEGNLWIGTNGGGLNKLDKKTGRFQRFSYGINRANNVENVIIMGIEQDDSGNIWIGEYLKGLSIYYPVTQKFRRIFNTTDDFTPVLDGVYSIYKDDSGIMWICNEGKGLYFYNSGKAKFKCYRNDPLDKYSLSDNIVWAISEDNDKNIWVGNRHGLSILNPETNKFLNIPHNPDDENTVSDNSIRCIFKDSKGYMWLGTQESALDRYELSSGKIMHFYKHPDDTFRALSNVAYIVEDKDGLLWLGTYSNGLKVFNKDRTKITTYIHDDNNLNSISSNGIWSLSIDKDDNIWICTYITGLDKFDTKTGKFINYRNNPQDSNSISSNIVSYVYQDKKGIFWITTYGGGMNRFDEKNNTFKRYTTNEGLPDNCLYGILEDEYGRFWISSNQGLSRFDPVTEKFVNYNTADGLQSQDFNQNCFYKSSSGMFYFAGTNGLNSFNPSDFKENKSMPSLVFTSFKLYNKEAELPVSISEAEEIELSYNDNFFTIEFAAIEFTNPSKIKYAYLLEGTNEKWNYVNNERTAHYTNISPGNYVFRVKYTNSDGVWNEEGKSLRIVIIPPWWNSWWFKGLFIILIVITISYILKKRITSERNKQKIKEEFTRQLLESQEQERKRIAFELHDSIVQNLLVVKNKALLLLRSVNSVKKLKNDIKEITEGISDSMDEIRTISHNLTPYEVDRFGLVNSLEMLIEKMNKSSAVNFSFNSDKIDEIMEKNAEMNIFRIIQECLSNISKHSRATNANLKISRSDEIIKIEIKDDGKGFDVGKNISQPSGGGIGLKAIKERTNLLKGKVIINSEPGKGSEVIIIIPI